MTNSMSSPPGGTDLDRAGLQRRSAVETLASARELHGLKYHSRLGHTFLMLGFGAAVCHDAGAGLNVHRVPPGNEGADGYRQVEVARIREVPDTPTVDSSVARLEFLDDLH